MIHVQHSLQRQRMLLSGVRSLRRVAKSSSPSTQKQPIPPASSQKNIGGNKNKSKATANGFYGLGLMQPLLDGIAAQGTNCNMTEMFSLLSWEYANM